MKTLALVNNKDGVGKTTFAVTLTATAEDESAGSQGVLSGKRAE